MFLSKIPTGRPSRSPASTTSPLTLNLQRIVRVALLILAATDIEQIVGSMCYSERHSHVDSIVDSIVRGGENQRLPYPMPEWVF